MRAIASGAGRAGLSSRATQATRSDRAGSARLVLGLVCALIAVTVGMTVWQRFKPAPATVVPEDMSGLDGSVARLVSGQLSAVNGAPREAATHGKLGLIYEANEMYHEAQLSFANAAELDPECECVNTGDRYFVALRIDIGEAHRESLRRRGAHHHPR